MRPGGRGRGRRHIPERGPFAGRSGRSPAGSEPRPTRVSCGHHAERDVGPAERDPRRRLRRGAAIPAGGGGPTGCRSSLHRNRSERGGHPQEQHGPARGVRDLHRRPPREQPAIGWAHRGDAYRIDGIRVVRGRPDRAPVTRRDRARSDLPAHPVEPPRRGRRRERRGGGARRRRRDQRPALLRRGDQAPARIRGPHLDPQAPSRSPAHPSHRPRVTMRRCEPSCTGGKGCKGRRPACSRT